MTVGVAALGAQDYSPDDVVVAADAVFPAAAGDFIEVETVSGGDVGSVNVAQPALDASWIVPFQTGMNATTHFRLKHKGGGIGPIEILDVRLEGSHAAEFKIGTTWGVQCTLREAGTPPPSSNDPCVHDLVDIRVGFKPAATGNRVATLVIETDQGDLVISLTGRGVTGDIHYRINAGGGVFHDPDRSLPSFGEDVFRNASAYQIRKDGDATGPTGTVVVDKDSTVPSAVPTGIFTRWRVHPSEIEYAFPVVSTGAHQVRLFFAELTATKKGDRVMDVRIEGSRVLRSFDIFDEAGPLTGTARTFRVSSDDILNLRLISVVSSPVLQGIEVRKVSDTSAVSGAVNATDFGTVAIGSTVTRPVTISNTGGPTAAAFRVDGVSLGGPGAGEASHNFSGSVWIGPGGSHTFDLTLQATSAGDKSVDIAVSVWAAPNLTKTVSGSAVAPVGSLSAPSSQDFGEVRIGSSVDRIITLSNNSSVSVSISDLFIVGGSDHYAVINSPVPTSLAPGSSVDVSVRFAPASTGSHQAVLRIEHTGTNRPSDVALSGTGLSRFVDIDHSIFKDDINWMASTGITRGCNPPVNDRFCPNDFVTRGQMAAFFVRALGLTDDGGGNRFVDTGGSVFAGDIDRMATAGITRGCNPPVNDRFCPNDFVTRGQMAAFFHRAAELMGLSG